MISPMEPCGPNFSSYLKEMIKKDLNWHDVRRDEYKSPDQKDKITSLTHINSDRRFGMHCETKGWFDTKCYYFDYPDFFPNINENGYSVVTLPQNECVLPRSFYWHLYRASHREPKK